MLGKLSYLEKHLMMSGQCIFSPMFSLYLDSNGHFGQLLAIPRNLHIQSQEIVQIVQVTNEEPNKCCVETNNVEYSMGSVRPPIKSLHIYQASGTCSIFLVPYYGIYADLASKLTPNFE